MPSIWFSVEEAGFYDGVVLYPDQSFQLEPFLCWHNVWNSQDAHFQQCFVPILTAIPSLLTILLLLGHVICLLTTWRPRWTSSFVSKSKEIDADDALVAPRIWTLHLKVFTGLVGIGLVIQATSAIYAGYFLSSTYNLTSSALVTLLLSVLTWSLILSLAITTRPRTTPLALVLILLLEAIVLCIRLTASPSHFGLPMYCLVAILAANVLTFLVALDMPFRDPSLSGRNISTPFSEPTSALRSPEDSISLWQWMTVAWLSPIIGIGSKRQLQDEDVWQLPYEFHHRLLHDNFRLLKGSVLRRLLKANSLDLVLLSLLGLLELLMNFSQPLLLQALLSSMEDPSAPTKSAIIYAAFAMTVRLVAAQSSVFSLWFGRRCYERSRGEMITMLYEKTLNRKVGFYEEKEDKATQRHGKAKVHHEDEILKKSERGFWQRIRLAISSRFGNRTATPPSKQPASMGKILNLMRNDVYEVAQRFWEVQDIVQKPLAIIFSITLLLRLLGPSALLAVFAMIISQSIIILLSKGLIYFEKKRRVATDVKLQIISQFVEAIRHLRWYGWQGAWLENIMDARQKELNLRIITACWNIAINFFNTLAVDMTPVIAFFAYTVIAGKPLRVDVGFPAMQVCRMLTGALRGLPGLIIVWINAMVAVGRIEDFMAEPDLDEMATEALIGDSLALENASFAWPGALRPVVKNITLSFPPGLTVICGEVASGKTALLQALLGELDMLHGQLFRPREALGYCAQTPWLQSMSIRDNILFSAPYEEVRYKAVLDACALTPDLAEFKAGDLSLIGENGIGLSGGQRARVALARAVYSKANILLLDDPLSALDQQTAEGIVQKCFAGSPMKGRTIVLVTHRTDLVLGLATQVVRLERGEARILDNDAAVFQTLQPVKSLDSVADEDAQQQKAKRDKAAVPDNFIEEEHRAHGGVQARVYWEYVKAGRLRWWIILVIVLAAWRFGAVMESWVIKSWGEAYQHKAELKRVFFFQNDDAPQTLSGPLPLDGLPPPDEDIKPWLLVFFLVALSQPILGVLQNIVMIVIVYTAGRRMFRDIMHKVANATFRFYDVTPIGRLMNRMTSDIGVIDGGISEQFKQVAWYSISWISSVIVIASVTPVFLVFSTTMTIVFVVIFLRFLPTSQSLRRLEMVSLSPLMSNFGALLNGLTTVRAFGAQARFQDRVIAVVDTFQKMDHFYWSLQAWLMYRYDCLSAVSTFILTLLALATKVTPGLTAFVLFAADKYVSSTHALCRQYGQLQMEFVSVERVVELMHVDQEPEGSISPPAWWPSFSGVIEFRNVTIRYAPHLEPALRDVSFTIKGGSKIAIIGRTGSGKSTLALSILATVLPNSGSIHIDNVDLATVDRQLLRTRITFLAQDPVLFPGTMRQNLDPTSEYSDEACISVLERVCRRQGWSLDTKIEAHGHNLSQGQRQLVGLVRAVLRRSAIIILDEATASIDRETAMQIQQVMHEDLKESTVITIAHRLEAVRNADYCIVLGEGRILEQGPAEDMLKDHSYDMVEQENE